MAHRSCKMKTNKQSVPEIKSKLQKLNILTSLNFDPPAIDIFCMINSIVPYK